MAQHTDHEIIGVENMSYFESEETRKRYIREGGGQKLADELNTELLGQLPLGCSRTGTKKTARQFTKTMKSARCIQKWLSDRRHC